MSKSTPPNIGVEFPARASSGVPRNHYYDAYYLAVRECLQVEFDVTNVRQKGPVITWVVGDKRIRTMFDYADDPSVQPHSEDLDLIFKMKYCDRKRKEYDASPVPVVPGGYPIIGVFPFVQNRRNFFARLHRLRARRERCINGTPWKRDIVTRGAYSARSHCPERARLYDPSLESSLRMEWPSHIADVAQSRMALNICCSAGHNTVDRKPIEYCAVGTAMISSLGLADLRLPRDTHFEHGENVLFFDEIEDVAILRSTCSQEEVAHLTHGSQTLFDESCSPQALCRYWREEVEKLC